MKQITIKGEFSNNGNNLLILEVYRPNVLQNPYEFKKTFTQSFQETLSDLVDETVYHIDFVGHTPEEIMIEISGQFESPNPISNSFEATGFSAGYTIKTT
ncbi:MAG: hypothetical protein ACQUHE_09045 [Bacteroidia bacterium]